MTQEERTHACNNNPFLRGFYDHKRSNDFMGGCEVMSEYCHTHPAREMVEKVAELTLQAWDTERHGETEEQKIDWIIKQLKEQEDEQV